MPKVVYDRECRQRYMDRQVLSCVRRLVTRQCCCYCASRGGQTRVIARQKRARDTEHETQHKMPQMTQSHLLTDAIESRTCWRHLGWRQHHAGLAVEGDQREAVGGIQHFNSGRCSVFVDVQIRESMLLSLSCRCLDDGLGGEPASLSRSWRSTRQASLHKTKQSLLDRPPAARAHSSPDEQPSAEWSQVVPGAKV